MAREIVMPSVGMDTAEGELTAWLAQTGESVEAGEPVAEITTEKATYQLEAPVAGIVHHSAQSGTILQVQEAFGYILAPGEEPPPAPVKRLLDQSSQRAAAARPALGRTPKPLSPKPPASSSLAPLPGARSGIRASPIARRLAAQHGVDLALLDGSGPGGRIVEADVKAAAAQAGRVEEAPVAPRGVRVLKRIPLLGTCRTIAKRLRHSLSTAAPVTFTREVDVEALVAARPRLAGLIGGVV